VRAIVYSEGGGPDVLRLVERPEPTPGPGEVRVGVHVSGVNPTDWKARSRGPRPGMDEVVPNQDGAGVVEAVGTGVSDDRVGERVWIWEAAWQRPNGTAQEVVVLPSRQAVRLPDGVSFENYGGGVAGVIAFLAPIIGLLAMTAEWTQRTALTTFTLAPRRGRVLGAKFTSAMILAMATLAVGLVLAVVTTLVGGAVHGGASWAGAGTEIRSYVIVVAAQKIDLAVG